MKVTMKVAAGYNMQATQSYCGEIRGEYETAELSCIQVVLEAEYGREYAETCYSIVNSQITRT